ncbi:PREDICTED: signal recognition particle 9 kDa protein [Pygoscelis adeliae]|uniref:signal recognition particle 9 kDa protein n=1 Tax=Pygoscelis adeliae TaxID=9238 RepID=UPI0004F4EC5B|nr:PREDICTED: signal recognition particle 9 kDa protein [Pygoscelis adeliae]
MSELLMLAETRNNRYKVSGQICIQEEAFNVQSVAEDVDFYHHGFENSGDLRVQDDCGQVRVVLKYRHCDGNLCIKVTDDVACLLYRTDQAQDVKKIEKFHSQLMRLMVAKESRSAAMETD